MVPRVTPPARALRALALLALLLVAYALRTTFLTQAPFWYDEGLSVDLARAPLYYTLNALDRPPLYYLLLHAWITLCGSTPFAFRYFSVLASTLAVALTYPCTRAWLGPRSSAYALALATCSPFYLYYAQETRTYALTLTLAIATAWAWHIHLTRGGLRPLATACLCAALACYTHYAALLLLPVLAAWAVLRSYHRPNASSLPLHGAGITPHGDMQTRAVEGAGGRLAAQTTPPDEQHARAVTLLAIGITLALFAPWLWHVRDRLAELAAPSGSLALSATSAITLLWRTQLEFSAGRTLSFPAADALTLLMLFLAILGALTPSAHHTTRAALLLLWFTPIAALLLLPRTSVYFSPKYALVAVPAYYALVAHGLATLHTDARTLGWLTTALLALGLASALVEWFAAVHFKGA